MAHGTWPTTVHSTARQTQAQGVRVRAGIGIGASWSAGVGVREEQALCPGCALCAVWCVSRRERRLRVTTWRWVHVQAGESKQAPNREPRRGRSERVRMPLRMDGPALALYCFVLWPFTYTDVRV